MVFNYHFCYVLQLSLTLLGDTQGNSPVTSCGSPEHHMTLTQSHDLSWVSSGGSFRLIWQPLKICDQIVLPVREKWMQKTVSLFFYCCCSHLDCLVVWPTACGTSRQKWPVNWQMYKMSCTSCRMRWTAGCTWEQVDSPGTKVNSSETCDKLIKTLTQFPLQTFWQY